MKKVEKGKAKKPDKHIPIVTNDLQAVLHISFDIHFRKRKLLYIHLSLEINSYKIIVLIKRHFDVQLRKRKPLYSHLKKKCK